MNRLTSNISLEISAISIMIAANKIYKQYTYIRKPRTRISIRNQTLLVNNDESGNKP